jgi:methylated-DNA-[protein]-cysteine S-methyltransferase
MDAAMKGETTFDTAWGPCHIAWSDRGVHRVRLPPQPAARARVDPPPFVRSAIDLLQAYFTGESVDFSSVPLDFGGTTAFRLRVYQALRAVPRGRVVDYGELASAAGSAGAARAVGQAMAHNPLPLFVPCHRVVSASGHIGGFSAPGGRSTKRRLLELEAIELQLREGVATPTRSVLTLSEARP